MLNDVTFVEAARGFAERMMRGPGTTPEARLAAAFPGDRRGGRGPRSWPSCSTAFATSSARFRRDPRGGAALIQRANRRPTARLDPAELAAYTAMAQLILNLDETITKE